MNRKLFNLYKQGVNLCAYLREKEGVKENTVEIIKKSYDTRAGMDVDMVKSGKIADHVVKYSLLLSQIIESYIKPESILEAGVGEGITLLGVAKYFTQAKIQGFDISPNRIKVAKKWLKENGVNTVELKTGNLLGIPYRDNSFDVVYTSHAIEPNRGKEEQILQELYRVAKKYLFLLEPGYEFAKPEYQKRMESLSFVKGLREVSERLGYKVLKHELFPLTVQVENPTAILIIKKQA
jgi:ubiquinone/menaquinone biosynthesis C-methylase UbiE